MLMVVDVVCHNHLLNRKWRALVFSLFRAVLLRRRLNLIMDLLVMMLLVLPLVLTGAEVQNVKEVRGKLGQDVSLNCSIRDTDVYWSMEILRQFRLSIAHTYFPTEKVSYNLPEFKTKYLIKGNILVIRNVSSEDVRLYYCGRRINNSINVEDAFLLVSGT